MVNYKEIYRFSRLQMGSNFFQGVQLFPGGVQLLITYRNPFNLCSPHSFMVKATIYTLSHLGLANVNRQKNLSSFYTKKSVSDGI